MTATIEQTDVWFPGFGESEFSNLIAGCGEQDAAARKVAFDRYRLCPVPTLRDEEWRRTDPDRIPFAGMKRLEGLDRAADPDRNDLDQAFDLVISISDRGYAITDRTGILAEGKAQVCPLSQMPADALGTYLHGEAVLEANRKYTQLNGAFWNVGFFIRIPANQVLAHGILIRYEHTTPGSILLPRLVVVAESGSVAKVVEWYQSPDDVKLLCVGARELYVREAARLTVQAVQEWGVASTHVGEDWARVEKDGQIDWVTLTLGSGFSKMMVGCDVAEANANAYLSGLFFANEHQHIDQRTLQKHSAPHTYSNLLYKGAVKDSGHSVYQGVIAAAPGAIGVDAYQMNNNLILNTGARADSLPGLMIDADDLKCSHGATMGNIDPHQLFYLQSRGFSEVEARRMLVLAFFEEIIAKLNDSFLEDRIRADVNRKIG